MLTVDEFNDNLGDLIAVADGTGRVNADRTQCTIAQARREVLEEYGKAVAEVESLRAALESKQVAGMTDAIGPCPNCGVDGVEDPDDCRVFMCNACGCKVTVEHWSLLCRKMTRDEFEDVSWDLGSLVRDAVGAGETRGSMKPIDRDENALRERLRAALTGEKT